MQDFAFRGRKASLLAAFAPTGSHPFRFSRRSLRLARSSTDRSTRKNRNAEVDPLQHFGFFMFYLIDHEKQSDSRCSRDSYRKKRKILRCQRQTRPVSAVTDSRDWLVSRLRKARERIVRTIVTMPSNQMKRTRLCVCSRDRRSKAQQASQADQADVFHRAERRRHRTHRCDQ